RSGRRWLEVVNRDVLARVPLFQTADAVCLHKLAMTLRPAVYAPGELILREGEMGQDMYVISRGQVEVLDGSGRLLNTLGEGEYFGELSLLLSRPRNATIRA